MTISVIGLNHKSANIDIREKFSFTADNASLLLRRIKKIRDILEVIVVSTCNRTEIYSFAKSPSVLVNLLCEESNGNHKTFENLGYIFENTAAINHIFNVGTGLDSQILGDFEIIGQLKNSFNLSKDNQLIGSFMERLTNSVIQASKRIKTETKISSGATSVAYAAVQFIIHEVMGRNCGWLTAKSADVYRQMLQKKEFLPEILVNKKRWDIHAVFVPEMEINMESEMNRLREIMDKHDCVNIFLSEGAGLDSIISDMEKNGEQINRDAFGHVRLDEINPGKWFAEKFANAIGAEKVLVQKSGYFARSAASNPEDLDLIFKSVEFAVDSALGQNSGVAGLDDDLNSEMSCIDFKRIKGGKPFDVKESWFVDLLSDIGQY